MPVSVSICPENYPGCTAKSSLLNKVSMRTTSGSRKSYGMATKLTAVFVFMTNRKLCGCGWGASSVPGDRLCRGVDVLILGQLLRELPTTEGICSWYELTESVGWSARKPRQQREKGLTLPETSSIVCDRQ